MALRASAGVRPQDGLASPARMSAQYPGGSFPSGAPRPASPGSPGTQPTYPTAPRTQPYGSGGAGGPAGPGGSPDFGGGSGPFGRGRLILIIVIAVVVVGAAIFGGYLFARGGQSGGTSPTQSLLPTPSAPTDEETPTPDESATPTPTATPSTSATPSASTAQHLPASAALPQNLVVVPMRKSADDDRALYLVDAEGATDPVRLPTPAGDTSNPMVQASRDTIIYLRNGVLRVMAADGTGDRKLFNNDPAGCTKIQHAAWSLADPNLLLISCPVAAGRTQLFVIGLDGKLVRRLEVGRSIAGDFGLSADGQTVVYWASNNPNRDGGSLFTLPIVGTGSPKQLTNVADGVDSDAAWSPDGTQIAFRRRIPNGTLAGNYDVYLINVDGTGLRPMATTPAQDLKPVWSPDGKNLLIVSNRKSAQGGPGKTYDLWLIRVSDREVVSALGLKAAQFTRPFWTLR